MLRPLIYLLLGLLATNVNAQTTSFDTGWAFVKAIDTTVTAALFQKTGQPSPGWKPVSLPHTANIEPLVIIGDQWQGTCFYRKFFTAPATNTGKRIALRFEAAMHEADVYLNGQRLAKHLGGYLPFEVDLTGKLKPGAENCVLVKLNNQDNPAIPPGKPIKTLDFNYYGGLYRHVFLVVQDKLHIPDAVQAGRVAGGGVRVQYENVSRQTATVNVQTEVKNEDTAPRPAQIRLTLTDADGKPVGQMLSTVTTVPTGAYVPFTQSIPVPNPRLWSTTDPYLYRLLVEVLQAGKVIEQQRLSLGIRTIRFAADGFYLNGDKLKIRGTNRHQDYPYIGYALSDNAQYRDAWKLKAAGFNFVRCSHYPPSPAFLDACDALGLLVMDAIPGWQFPGDRVFQENSLQNVRDLVRRDRNHPSIVLWEASLNESDMKKDYMEKAHQAVHDERPFADVFTCGWLDAVYDVFIPARQHAKPPAYWNKYDKPKPLLIAEYGDWEYYAQNAGFNQTAYGDLKENERTSRQQRGDGEKRLAQQALNFQEAHNDNLNGPAVGDANWLYNDYNRGYAPDLETSGVVDIFRLPKFAYYFYQSQYGPAPDKVGFGKPMAFIANYWTPTSAKEVVVYSNCDEVALLLNGKPVARQTPDKNANTTNLLHPPFTFTMPGFTPGTLTAVGYINGKKVVETERRTPGPAVGLKLTIDRSGKDPQAGQNDVVFVYAEVVDAQGTVVPDAKLPVRFTVAGDAQLTGDNPIKAEAGIATVLLTIGQKSGPVQVSATAVGLKPTSMTVIR